MKVRSKYYLGIGSDDIKFCSFLPVKNFCEAWRNCKAGDIIKEHDSLVNEIIYLKVLKKTDKEFCMKTIKIEKLAI